jgi:hypothetical protein
MRDFSSLYYGFRKAEKVFLGGASVLASRSGYGFSARRESRPTVIRVHPCPSVVDFVLWKN